ncbi:hypothetical protein DEU56DRAFT_914157 [Suillus clintonianus]|uniref:uncharacterized protein n=1 Tax=Suillus clintonianus TaxID=1904413 RepID=UPI001B871846|nr:uncharacterized protein DEU56DRAFT_914157 [Suillus clintonianus]KAG2132346.1 hypothetical protein DEU56DRAFT_914157 [Suillus clintonianus]
MASVTYRASGFWSDRMTYFGDTEQGMDDVEASLDIDVSFACPLKDINTPELVHQPSTNFSCHNNIWSSLSRQIMAYGVLPVSRILTVKIRYGYRHRSLATSTLTPAISPASSARLTPVSSLRPLPNTQISSASATEQNYDVLSTAAAILFLTHFRRLGQYSCQLTCPTNSAPSISMAKLMLSGLANSAQTAVSGSKTSSIAADITHPSSKPLSPKPGTPAPVFPGCKEAYIDFEKHVLYLWYTIAFSLVPLQLVIMLAGLLCSNHVTHRFGKGTLPWQVRFPGDEVAFTERI